MFVKLNRAGKLLDVRNEGDGYMDVTYASVTAPQLTYVEVSIDGKVHDGVYIGPGASHSWWTNAGGKLFPTHGIPPGKRAVVTADGPCAFRCDWIE